MTAPTHHHLPTYTQQRPHQVPPSSTQLAPTLPKYIQRTAGNPATGEQPTYQHVGATGTPTPAHNYTTCEYTAHNDTPKCTQPAIMMPGYQRACAAHIAHMLLASMQHYTVQAQQANKYDPNIAQHIAKLAHHLTTYIQAPD